MPVTSKDRLFEISLSCITACSADDNYTVTTSNTHTAMLQNSVFRHCVIKGIYVQHYESSNPLLDCMAYSSFSFSCALLSYCGSFNKFIHVAADGSLAVGFTVNRSSAVYVGTFWIPNLGVNALNPSKGSREQDVTKFKNCPCSKGLNSDMMLQNS